MTSFIERRVNEVCGRWLDGFTKDNVEISLLQAKITLSDLHFKTLICLGDSTCSLLDRVVQTSRLGRNELLLFCGKYESDELCLLSPALAPSFFYVGQLSIDVPLAFNLSRPMKITVSDVLAVIRVGDHHGMAPEDARRTISANVHVKALLSRLAAELCGGFDNRGQANHARKISARTVAAVHKVVQNMEMSVKGLHMRLEQSEGRSEGGNEREDGVALGICLRDISLGPDNRATKAGVDGKSESRGRWIGEKFCKMEIGLFGKVSRYDCPKFDDVEDPRENEETSRSKETGSAATLMIAKFASVRGLLVYFCRDRESYSANDREQTLLRLKEGLKTPPDALPPLLGRCRAGLGLAVSLSASDLGKMHSLDVRFLLGDINIQISDDHIAYLLKWVQELDGNKRTLALNAVRPVEDSVIPDTVRMPPNGSDDGKKKSRFYRALWRYAVEVVMRDLRSSLEQRAQLALIQLQLSQASQTKRADDLPWSSKAREYRVTRGLLWRMWLGEWVRAARYLSLRELIHPWLLVEQFRDQAGAVHEKLHEDLHIEAKAREGYSQEQTTSTNAVPPSADTSCSTKVLPAKLKLAKYSMPWQLPQEDVDEAWALISRKCLRWEIRHARGVGAAMEEEREDVEQLRPEMLQALWSIQLQMDAQLAPRICATSRRMAVLRVGLRQRIDFLWQARAEKQRRLRLGLADLPSTSPRSTGGAIASSVSDASSNPPSEYVDTLATSVSTVYGGENTRTEEGADRVGTLLVRMGQLDGVGGVGLLSLAPKAVATLVLEERSATVEEMDMETSNTKVAIYDESNQRCCWDEIFQLQVELDESYVQQLRRERQSKRRVSSDAPAKDMINPPMSLSPESIHSPRKSYRPKAVVTDGANRSRMGGDEPSGGVSETRIGGSLHEHNESIDTQTLKAPEARCSSFLLAVSCFDTGLFGVTQLGVTTLSSKQLTEVPLKAMEHRCALFSAVAVDQQSRELTFHTIFVPPGDDVACGEQDLKAIGERRRLHETVGMEESRGVNSVGRQIPSFESKAKGPATSVSSTSKPADEPPLQRTPLDNVGDCEVRVLPLVADKSPILASTGSIAEKFQDLSPFDAWSKYTTNFSSFSLIELGIPCLVAVSVRVAGLKVGTYVNATVAMARTTRSDTCMPEQDRLAGLTEILGTEIEVCGDVNIESGKIAARIGATTIELRDNSLLKINSPSTIEADVQKPQLMRAGPLGLELGAAFLTSTSIQALARGALENGHECFDKPLSMEGRSPRETPKAPTKLPERALGLEPLGNGTGSSKEEIFWDALGSMDKWIFAGRLILGRFTAELGTWRGRKVAEEVWRRFRFMVSHRSLESTVQDTQILRGATTDASGMVTNTSWLLRAGSTSLSLDVEVPQQQPSAQSRSILAPGSPPLYVYVSSSESSSESDTSTTTAGRRSNARGTTNQGTIPPHSRVGSVRFPSTFNSEDEEFKARRPQATSKQFGMKRFPGEKTLTDESRSDGTVMVLDLMTNAELMRRVKELEAEVATLKEAAVSVSNRLPAGVCLEALES